MKNPSFDPNRAEVIYTLTLSAHEPWCAIEQGYNPCTCGLEGRRLHALRDARREVRRLWVLFCLYGLALLALLVGGGVWLFD